MLLAAAALFACCPNLLKQLTPHTDWHVVQARCVHLRTSYIVLHKIADWLRSSSRSQRRLVGCRVHATESMAAMAVFSSHLVVDALLFPPSSHIFNIGRCRARSRQRVKVAAGDNVLRHTSADIASPARGGHLRLGLTCERVACNPFPWPMSSQALVRHAALHVQRLKCGVTQSMYETRCEKCAYPPPPPPVFLPFPPPFLVFTAAMEPTAARARLEGMAQVSDAQFPLELLCLHLSFSVST